MKKLLTGLLGGMFLLHLGCSQEVPQQASVGLLVQVSFPPEAPAGDSAIHSMKASAYTETEDGLVVVAEDAAPISPGDTHFALELYVPPGSYLVQVHALDSEGIPLYSGSSEVGPISAGEDVSVSIQLLFARPFTLTDLIALSDDHETIRLGWKDPSPPNTVSYHIQRALGDETDTTWSSLDSLLSPGKDSVAYGDTGIPTRHPYLYRVRGKNPNGVSPWSNTAAGTLHLAAPQNLAANPVGTDQINLTWAYAGPDPKGFRLERSPRRDGFLAGQFLELFDLPGSSRTYSDSGLPRGTPYAYTLRAMGFDQSLSPFSKTVRVETGDIDPVCTVTADLAFNDVTLGAFVERTFTITNTGGMTVSGTVAMEPCLSFTLTQGAGPFELKSGESHSGVVRFEPDQVGIYQCSVSLETDCGDLEATGRGVGTLLCEVSLDRLDFASVVVGESVVLPLSVTNRGTADLDLAVALLEPCPDYSIISGAGTFTIPPNISHPVEIQFHPSSSGGKDCILELGSAACNTVDITGIGIGPICSVPDTIDFGDVFQDILVSRFFSISNDGGGFLEGVVSAPCNSFSISQGAGTFSLDANSELQVTVQFQSTILGPRECLIQLGTSCPGVVAVANVISAVLCQVDPSHIDFGEIEELTSTKRNVIVTNTGGGLLTATASLDCPAFSISGDASLSAAAGESDTISVLFSPEAAQTYTCTLSLGTDCGTVSLEGTGTLAPLCQAELAGPDSSNILVGDFFDYSFVIRNLGGGFLAGELTLGNCGEFSLLEPGDYNIAQGDSSVFTVRFSPTASGEQTCTVLTGCNSFPIKGIGNDFQACTVEPDTLEFGVLLFNQGNETAEETFVITNTGTVSISGTISKSCGSFDLGAGGGPFTLLPGETKEMTVIYNPSDINQHTCTILTGLPCGDVFARGEATLEAICLISNSTLEFGLVGVGNSTQETFTVFNSGGTALSGVINFDTADEEFSFVSGWGAYSLQGGEQLDVVVEFAPGFEDVPGNKSFSITVSEGCPPVTGTAWSAFCQVTPSPGNFGSQVLNSFSTQTFTLRNISTVSLGGFVDDTGCAPFSVFLGELATSLPFDLPNQGDIFEFDVLFNPTSPGDFTCALDLGSCGTLELTGSAPKCFLTVSTIDFLTDVGESHTQGVTIWNTGGGVLALTPSLNCDPGSDAPYISSGGSPVNLLNGQSHTVLITFTPTDDFAFYGCTLDLGSFCTPVPVTASTSYIGSPPKEPIPD